MTGKQQRKDATVLIVDDAARDRELLRELLEKEGYLVLEAESGEEALRLAMEASPDLILLDVMMPGLDGYEVCRRLRGEPRTRFIPVVMVTAHGDFEHRLLGIESGADEFLLKPVNLLELTARVRSLLKLRAYHDDLEESHRRLKESEELREKLTSLIIHDLNSPLSAILFNLSAVLADPEGKLGDREKTLLKRALRSGEQLAQMVRNLLDISRMEEGKLLLTKEPLQVADLIRESLAAGKEQAKGRGILLDTHLPPDLPSVPGDRELLGRVLSNLLWNALAYTSQGGSIRVTARPVRRSMIGVRHQDVADPPPDDEFLEISVQDTGVGIPEAYREKIFEKFAQIGVRVDQGRRGTGLGLTFCKLAVEAHGGRIWVESQEGRGSTFIFTLPLTDVARASRAS
ncbi:MAG: hybrid sensor histidine kinase/response regulator [candidate division NC10 bacterium]|nr:hybrid sensor histidine kinase/response regulator [candidate division NC10 bacterium]